MKCFALTIVLMIATILTIAMSTQGAVITQSSAPPASPALSSLGDYTGATLQLSADESWYQVFTWNDANQLESITFKVNTSRLVDTPIGTTPSTVNLSFWTITSGVNDDTLVLDTEVTTPEDFDFSSLTYDATKSYYTLTFAAPIALSNGTSYALEMDWDVGDFDKYGRTDSKAGPGGGFGSLYLADLEEFSGNRALAMTFVAVPEPSSMTLLGLGGLMMLRQRRA